MSIRTRLVLGTMVPLGFAAAGMGMAWVPAITGSASAGRFALLSVALLFVAIGTGLVLLQVNTQAVQRPLEDASAMTKALMQGQYGVHVRVNRLDETGQLLVALEQLGDYLAVMLPEPDDEASGRSRHTGPTTGALERIAEQLRGDEDRSATPTAVLPKASPTPSPAHLRLLTAQA
jgi:methyl-accepting chemotaxis protein